MSVFKNVADIQTADMLKLPVPEAALPQHRPLKPSEYQKEIVASLAERAEKVRNRMVDSTEDNMLLITNDGRKLAAGSAAGQSHAPPVTPTAKPPSARKMYLRIRQRTAGLTLHPNDFLRPVHPKDDGTFSVYDDIHAKLRNWVFPENEIAFIHNAKERNSEERPVRQGAERSGCVSFWAAPSAWAPAPTVSKSSSPCTTLIVRGVRPAFSSGRGRIIQEGNEKPGGGHFTAMSRKAPSTPTFTSLWESKQKFISQIETSKSPVRSGRRCRRTGRSYAEIEALASGNPYH